MLRHSRIDNHSLFFQAQCNMIKSHPKPPNICEDGMRKGQFSGELNELKADNSLYHMKQYGCMCWNLNSEEQISKCFRRVGVERYDQAIKWVHALPYGRNSDRANYRLIFSELKGSCSTKHAALAALAKENGFPVRLKVAICKLDTYLEPKVAPLLDRLGISFFPEAHCYLQTNELQIDVTFPDQSATLKAEILEAHTILPEEIGDYKVKIHQNYLRKWFYRENLDQRFSFDEIWQLREEWISSLSKRTTNYSQFSRRGC